MDQISPTVFEREVLKREVPVALYFFDAPSDWDAAFDEIADGLKGGLMIAQVDKAANPNLSRQWNAISPTLVVVRDGQEAGRKILAGVEPQEIADWLSGFAVHGCGCACHPN
jgi:hypothetical protein